MENTEIIRIERVGRFHFAEVMDTEKRIKAVGVSRKSFLDKFDDKKGEEIALGRARKALKKKLNKQPIVSAFMG